MSANAARHAAAGGMHARASDQRPLFVAGPPLGACRDCGQAKRMRFWRVCRACWDARHGRASKPGDRS
jgi:hypothetical protein